MDDATPMMRFRCTTTVNGHEATATMSLKQDVWDSADEQWRSEHLDHVRFRFAIWVHQETGTELTEGQIETLTVSTLSSKNPMGD